MADNIRVKERRKQTGRGLLGISLLFFRISIDTTRGEIRFLDTVPWADTLEALAESAAKENERRPNQAPDN